MSRFIMSVVFSVTAAGLLVGCSTPEDGDQVCRPGDAVCFVYSEFILRCSEDGTLWETEPCPEGTLCHEGECLALTCVPGEGRCSDDGGLETCLEDGSGWTEPSECAEGETCVDGECGAVVCDAGDLRCTPEGDVERCSSSGTDWQLFIECDEGLSCIDGLCLPVPCEPGDTACGRTTLYTCGDDGTWSGRPCPDGNPCVFGRCVECLGDGSCEAGEDCVDGVCEPTTPSILTTTLPPAAVGEAYEQALAVDGGREPYTWSVSSGALPDGLELATDGVIAGVPTTAGTFPFTARVADDHGQATTGELAIEVVEAGTVTITTTALDPADHGYPYDFTLSATGGTLPYAWQLLAGELPSGLHLGSGGDITGVPDEVGTFPLTFRVFDASTPAASDVRDFELEVAISPLVITGDTEYDLLVVRVIILPMLVPFIPYSTQLQARGGLTPYAWDERPAPDGLSWLIGEWGVPDGMTLDENGRLSGWVTDVSDAQVITIPFGPELAGYFFFAGVQDAQTPPDDAQAIFCIPTIPL